MSSSNAGSQKSDGARSDRRPADPCTSSARLPPSWLDAHGGRSEQATDSGPIAEDSTRRQRPEGPSSRLAAAAGAAQRTSSRGGAARAATSGAKSRPKEPADPVRSTSAPMKGGPASARGAGAPVRAVSAPPEAEAEDPPEYVLLEYFRRLGLWKVHLMRLFPWEEQFKRRGLKKIKNVDGCLGDMVTRYLCWRRAVLQAAGVFWLISLTIDAFKLFVNIRQSYVGPNGGISMLGVGLGPYAQYFRTYMTLEYAAQSVIILSGFLAVFFSFVAAYVWRKFKTSRPPAFISYMLGYSIPFIVYLLLSNRSSVDIAEIQQHLCRDILTGAYKEPAWVPGQIVDKLAVGDSNEWLAEKLVNAAKSAPNVTQAFGVDVAICSKDPSLWDESIRESLESSGRLAPEPGMPCPAAVTSRARMIFAEAGLVPDTSTNITDVEETRPKVCAASQCSACKSVKCLLYIPPQQKAKAGKGNSVDLQAVVDYKQDKVCGKCTEAKGLVTKRDGRVDSWSCNTLCVPYWENEGDWTEPGAEEATRSASEAIQSYGGERNAIGAAFDSLAVFDFCVQPQDLETVQLLTRVVVAQEPWEFLLGVKGAVTAMAALFPALFALMSGTIRGAIVAKMVIPYSRIPALVLTCAISYSLPYIVLVMIVCKAVVGDQGMLPAICCALTALMVFLPWQGMLGAKLLNSRDITESQNHKEGERAATIRYALHYIFSFLFCVFSAYWLARWAEIVRDLIKASLQGLEAETLREVVASESFWKEYATTLVSIMAQFFGFAKIAGVCFADNVLWAVASVDEANVDARQEAHSEEQEVALFAELHKGLLLREPKIHTKFDKIYRHVPRRPKRMTTGILASPSLARRG